MDPVIIIGISFGFMFCLQSFCFMRFVADNAILNAKINNLEEVCFVCTHEKHKTLFHTGISPQHSVNVHLVTEDPAE